MCWQLDAELKWSMWLAKRLVSHMKRMGPSHIMIPVENYRVNIESPEHIERNKI